MKSRLLLNIVVAESTAIFKLFAGEDQALLVGGDTLLILNFALYSLDGIRGFHLEGDGFTREA